MVQSLYRLRLFIGITWLFTTLLITASCSMAVTGTDVWAASDLANSVRNPNRTLQSQGEGTAVLFLIDESAGVAGKSRCSAVPDNLVLSVDTQDQFRYLFPRFYLTLWRTYYDPNLWQLEPAIGESPILSPPDLMVGVAQFGKEYHQLLPLTPIADVSAQQIESLPGNATDVLQAKVNDWSCYTYFKTAIDQAQAALLATGKTDLQLVLITDGLLRGTESGKPENLPSDEDLRARAAEDLRTYLQQEVSLKINVQILLVGQDICTQKDDPSCNGLQLEEFNIRQSDLAHWLKWEEQRLINLVDGRDPIRDFGQYVQHLLPASGRFEVVDSGNEREYSLTTLSGLADRTRLVVITLDRPESSPILVYKDQANKAVGLTYPYPILSFQSAYRFDTTLQPATQSICSSYTSRLSIQQSKAGLVYFWEHSNLPQPSLQNMLLSPEQIVVNGSNPSLNVSVQLDQKNLPPNPNCYQVFFKLGDSSPVRVDLPFASAGSQIVSHTFDSSYFPETVPWGDVQVSAGIVLKDSPQSPSIGSAPWPQTVRLVYDISVQGGHQITETLIRQNNDPDAVEMAISIAYAAKYVDYQPDFIPEFSLFPNEPENFYACEAALSSTPPSTPRSPMSETCLPQGTSPRKATPVPQGNDMIYQLRFPYYGVRGPNCNFKYLRVKWDNPTIAEEQCRWFEIVDNPPPPEPDTPTPTPTPPSDRDGDGIVDEIDACPDRSGLRWLKGCPWELKHSISVFVLIVFLGTVVILYIRN